MTHFMKQFVFSSERRTISPGYLGGLKSVLSQQTSDRALISVFDAISTGFASLHELVQTNEARRVSRYKYIGAMSDLREALSSYSAAKFLPTVVLLFALYEVTLTSCSRVESWRIHIDALLRLLEHNYVSRHLISDDGSTTLIQAVQATVSVGEDLEPLPVQELEPTQPRLLLDILTLKLRKKAPQLDSIFQSATPPRKLDVQKLRVSVKGIYRELALLPAALSHEARPIRYANNSKIQLYKLSQSAWFWTPKFYETYADAYIASKWNNLRATSILSAMFLLRCGDYLSSNETYALKREHANLCRTIQESADGICASVKFFLNNSNGQQGNDDFRNPQCIDGMIPISIKVLSGLLLMWPLYIVSKAPYISDSQRWWVKSTLQDIGERGRIPRALDLAVHDGDLNYSEVIEGMLLIDLGFVTMPDRDFQQMHMKNDGTSPLDDGIQRMPWQV